MDSSGKKIGAPLLALLLVAVLGMAVRYVPENADGALSTRVAQNPEPPRPSASTLFGGPEPLRRISELDLSALVPLAEDALPFSTSTLRDEEAEGLTVTGPLVVRPRLSPTRVLSDEEVFAILHPSYYLKYLSTIEDLMVGDGRLGPNEKQVFDSEAKVIAFWRDKVFDYIVLKGIMAPEDRTRFEYGLEVVQELHREEANYLRYDVQASNYKVIAFWEPFYERMGRGGGLGDIVAGLFVPRAQAQSDCSQSGTGSQEAGSNVEAVCCDCTINGVPVGCLNAVCSGRPAIYDQATGICGCG